MLKSSNSDPLVSVIIPTYNRRTNVVEAINSVFTQSYKNLEVLVIDDGSTDDTRNVLLQNFGDKINYVFIPHQGPSVARNIGVKISQGQYIALLDSDDVWTPEKIGYQMELIRLNDNIGLVWSNVIFSYPDSSRSTEFKLIDNLNISERLLKICLIETSSVLIRKSFFKKVGGFDENIFFHETWDLFYRLSRVAVFSFIERALAVRVCHGGNMVYDRSKRDRFLQDTEYFLKKLFEFPENKEKQNLKARCFSDIYRWVGLSDIRHDYKTGRKYLFKSLRYDPYTLKLYYTVLLALIRFSNFGGAIRTLKN